MCGFVNAILSLFVKSNVNNNTMDSTIIIALEPTMSSQLPVSEKLDHIFTSCYGSLATDIAVDILFPLRRLAKLPDRYSMHVRSSTTFCCCSRGGALCIKIENLQSYLNLKNCRVNIHSLITLSDVLKNPPYAQLIYSLVTHVDLLRPNEN